MTVGGSVGILTLSRDMVNRKSVKQQTLNGKK